MKSILTKKLLEGIVMGTMLFGSISGAYAPSPDRKSSSIKIENVSINYRRLSDSKDIRKVTQYKKPRNVRKTHMEIVSYAGEIDTLYVPEYFLKNKYLGKNEVVPPDHCARDAVYTARDLFGLYYNSEEAWNMRYVNKVVKSSNVIDIDSLEKFVNNKVLQPGMLIGFYYPKSDHNGGRDLLKNKRSYTHIGTFLGVDKYGSLRIKHEWGRESRVDDIMWFYGKGMLPKEIITVKEK